MWKPADYITEGKTCDQKSVDVRLDQLRRMTGARSAVLFVVHGKLFFRSLIATAADTPFDARRLREAMLGQRIDPDTVRLPGGSCRGPLAAVLGQHGLADREPFRQLVAAYGPGVPAQLEGVSAGSALAEHQATPCTPARVPPLDGPAATLIVLIDPAAGPLAAGYAEAVEDLWVMANGRDLLRVHRWTRMLRQFDGALDRLEDDLEERVEQEWPALTLGVADGTAGRRGDDLRAILHESATQLLGRAAQLTGSSVGHIYLAERTGSDSGCMDRLVLFAQLDPRTPDDPERDSEVVPPGRDILVGADDVPGRPRTVIEYAYSRKRPVLANDVAELSVTHPGVRYRSPYYPDCPDSYAELAVPIVLSTDGSTRGRDRVGDLIIGVLNVEKAPHLDTGFYTLRDLHALRHVAARFCHWQYRVLNHLSTVFLERLTRTVRTPQAAAPAAAEASGPAPPVEMWAARPLVARALQDVHEVTRSYEASVYLLSLCSRRLVRFCYFSRRQPTPPPQLATINIDRPGSTNAWVARNGTACFDPPMGRTYPGLKGVMRPFPAVRSECCFPIFEGGRLVGTLNLESDRNDGYREYRQIVGAVAAQIGLALGQARHEGDQGLGARNLQMAHFVHECLKRHKELRAVLDDWQPADARLRCEKLWAAFGRSLPYGPLASDPFSVPVVESEPGRLLQQLVRDKDPADIIAAFRGGDPEEVYAGRTVEPQVAAALSLAGQEVLGSAFLHAVMVQGGRAVIVCEVKPLGGGTFARVVVSNPDSTAQPADLIRQLYRRPFRYKPEDRLHFGAYIAGCLLRSVGGDIEAVSYDGRAGDRRVRTVIEFPLMEAPR